VVTREHKGASPAKHFSGFCQVVVLLTRTTKMSYLVKAFLVYADPRSALFSTISDVKMADYQMD